MEEQTTQIQKGLQEWGITSDSFGISSNEREMLAFLDHLLDITSCVVR